MSAEVLAAAQRRRFPEAQPQGDTLSHPTITSNGATWATTTINDAERPAHVTL
jgi:hypothetical protein